MAQFDLMRGYDLGNGNVREVYASPRTYKSYDEAINALLSLGKKYMIDMFMKHMHVNCEKVVYDACYDEHCGYGYNGLKIKSEYCNFFYFIKPVFI